MQYEVVSPLGQTVIEARPVPRHYDTLNGKTVCEVWNGGFRGHVVLPIVREMLKKKFPDVKVIPYTEFSRTPLHIQTPEQVAKKLDDVSKDFVARGCDAVIGCFGG
ncbi:hypothetical protein ACFLV0_06335 [Chloroflexota bacterium]